jgi:DNA-binding transcriptional MerR regulator
MKIEDDPLMSISDFAQRSGVNASALRFYESLGLIESVRSGGRRRYHRLACGASPTSCLRSVGFTLEEIAAQLARLPTRHVPHGRLAEDVAHLAAAAGRAHRRAAAPARQPQPVHRRLSVAQGLQHVQPRRPMPARRPGRAAG